MKTCYATLVLLLTVLAVSVPAAAAPIPANCAADFSSCDIPENVLFQLPFLAISGDVLVKDPNGTTISDVFRIFNDIFDTGGGTGLGDLAFLYSSDEGALPAPSTFSVNAVTIPESASGITDFNGNGTDYRLAAPEPSLLPLLVVFVLTAGIVRRGYARRSVTRT